MTDQSLIAALGRYLRRDENANATNSEDYRGGMLALTAALAREQEAQPAPRDLLKELHALCEEGQYANLGSISVCDLRKIIDGYQAAQPAVRTDPTQPWTVEHLKNYPKEAVRVLNERLAAQPAAQKQRSAIDWAKRCGASVATSEETGKVLVVQFDSDAWPRMALLIEANVAQPAAQEPSKPRAVNGLCIGADGHISTVADNIREAARIARKALEGKP